MVFRYISRKLRFIAIKNKYKDDNTPDEAFDRPLLNNLKKNLEVLNKVLGGSSDVIFREFNFGPHRKTKGALIYINGMVDKDVIHKNVLQPLMYDSLELSAKGHVDFNSLDSIQKDVISVSHLGKVSLLCDLLDNLLAGSTVFLVDGSKEALVINAKKFEKRSIEEPQTEGVVRGPRQGFTENLKTNLAMLRRIIKAPGLCIETVKIGRRTKTDVCIAYLKDIANPKVINEIRLRLKRINTDAILESGYIEQFIEDNPYSIFATIANSEKPDKVAAKILEGRTAIFVDGTPFVLTAPMLFIESFQSAEDYYSRPFMTNLVRLIRFLSYFISILAPATYVALTTFHQELIPTELLITIAAGHEQVPFPAVLEAAVMMLTFDILREAGVRLPKPVGTAISIVGALVLGESAVSAGLIGPFMVIVVAITAIASFVVAAQTDSGAILRYIFLALAGFAGGYGVLMGLLVVLMHLASLRSFGTPYLSPIAPLELSALKDSFIRMPLWTMKNRSKTITWRSSIRQDYDLAPSRQQENKQSPKG